MSANAVTWVQPPVCAKQTTVLFFLVFFFLFILYGLDVGVFIYAIFMRQNDKLLQCTQTFWSFSQHEIKTDYLHFQSLVKDLSAHIILNKKKMYL